MHVSPNALSVNAIIWYVTCKMEGENTGLEAVGHSFAITDSDPDGGIGVKHTGTISEQYLIRN